LKDDFFHGGENSNISFYLDLFNEMKDKAEVTAWQRLAVLIRTGWAEFFNFLTLSNKASKAFG
jgi:hypothetical protein